MKLAAKRFRRAVSGTLAAVIILIIVVAAVGVYYATEKPATAPPSTVTSTASTIITSTASTTVTSTASTTITNFITSSTTASSVNPQNLTIVIGSTEYPAQGICPYNNSFDTGFNIDNQIYEGLTALSQSGSVVPDLATSWTANSNDTVWTFNLRQGVSFQDGTPFNATAVKFSFTIAEGTLLGQAALVPYLQSMTVVSPYVIQFNMKTPFSAWPQELTIVSGRVVSPTAYQKSPSTFCTTGNVGTGPFSFVKWVPNDEVVLTRNMNYWNASQIPKAQTFIWKFFTDSNALVLALENHEIDSAFLQIPGNQVSVLAATPGISHISTFYTYTYFLGLNYRFAPLNNTLVRKAIAYALDYPLIAQLDNATRADTLFPTTIFGPYNADPQANFTYSPNYAKQLLAQAGFPNGISQQLGLYYSPTQFGPAVPDIMTVIQQDLTAIGINAVLKPQDPATLSTTVSSGEAPMAFYRLATQTPDPDFLATFSWSTNSGNGWSRWGFNNATANSLVIAGREATNTTQRIVIYHQLQNEFDSQPADMIYLYNEIHYVFFLTSTVHGLTGMGPYTGFEINWSQVY